MELEPPDDEPDALPAAAVPRPAATVVVCRQAPDGLEVLLTQRPSTMAFAADLHVFPGGAVDPGDEAQAAVERSVVDPDRAARLLGGDTTPEQAVGAFVAAVRELWE
ncbi:MAG TPA: NUDIX domain-containing protein, partial [Vitreimonas sp.]|nr:NUDIX domain-containing protein [Vitreimonas sp.]